MAVRFEMVSGIERVDPAAWNRLSRQAAPMLEWEYLYSLERSGVLSPERGFVPRHILAYNDGRLVATAPLYERTRPWVEFGDGGLLRFLGELTGFPYYVGLMATVPLTPVPAYQFLYGSPHDAAQIYTMMAEYVDFVCETRGFATWRIYFFADPSPGLHEMLLRKGFVGLRSEYCLWQNKGYQSFDDFLATFRAPRRHKIRREIRDIEAEGIRLAMVPGEDVPEDYYDIMFDLYSLTWRKYMGHHVRPFLNRRFFHLLGRLYRHRLLFSVAHQGRELLAMAVFYHKGKQLYGRYWGSYDQIPFLHFAVCYYEPIRFAISHGIETFDPGFGGEHKTYRGFESTTVQHYIKFYGEEQVQTAYSILGRYERAPKNHDRLAR
ncbi:MAG: GNAT family N-acetyltransferase [Desulfosoma sp.]|uniref:GNAT family N-acetyltransferase n=1 Tax=Desulfosoma sp. TaxID=2603217 RepID=UPI0040498B9C